MDDGERSHPSMDGELITQVELELDHVGKRYACYKNRGGWGIYVDINTLKSANGKLPDKIVVKVHKEGAK